MRVALDATPLTAPPGGIRRYTAELSAALAREFPEDDFLLVSDQDFEAPAGLPNLRRVQSAQGLLRRRWWSLGLPAVLRRGKATLFHGTDFSVPYVHVRPAVMTVHDLSPWKPGMAETASRRVRRRTPWLLRLGLADMVITPTEAVRREVIEFFSLDPDRVCAVPLAAPRWLRKVEDRPLARPFILYVGARTGRKNIGTLIDAWREVRSCHPVDLVLAGPAGAGFELVPEDGLRLAGEVRDEELQQLYSTAVLFVYPSTYEGFGLPVLEAMQCGLPVVASRIPAIQEVAGEAAALVDPNDRKAWVEALSGLLGDGDRRRDLAARARARARRFSWSRTARETREVYEEAVRRVGR